MRRTATLFTGIVAYLLFAAAIDWLYRPDPAGIVALSTCESGDLSTPFYRRLPEPETLRLCGSFSGAPEVLVLPRLAGNAFALRVDGQTRLERGAPSRPANFWVQPQLVPLDGIASGEHAVELELHGLYDLGVRLPPYVTSWTSGGLRAGLLVWLTDDVVAVAAGVNLGVGVLLLAYGLQRRRHRSEAILFGLTAIAAILYVPDYMPNSGVLGPEAFLLRRKISLVGSYIFGGAIVAGLELSTRVRRRAGPVLLGVAALLSLASLVAPNQVVLKMVSTVGAATYLPLAFYGTWLAARHLEPRFAWPWVFFGASTVHLTYNLATGAGYLFLFHYGMLAAALGAGVRLTSQLAAMARELAFSDNLAIAPTDVVALVDFDEFKQVNDRFGHERGDQLLVDFVRAARLRLRGTDHVIRLGGDEFALVMRAATLAAARRVVEEVLDTWRKGSTDLEPKASYGLVEGRSETLERMLAEADRAMYAAKGRRRAERAAVRA